MECPCENCICMSVCKHKRYMALFQNCTILEKFEPNSNVIQHRDQEKIMLLEKVLQPTTWFISFRGIDGKFRKADDGLVWIETK